jgi:hypothetical protein
MMDEQILPDDLLSVPQAARAIPGFRGGQTASSTVFRWITTGVRQPDGTYQRLRALRVGVRWVTSRAWLREFIDRLTAAHQPGKQPLPAPRSPRKREAAIRRAEKRLEEIGA